MGKHIRMGEMIAQAIDEAAEGLHVIIKVILLGICEAIAGPHAGLAVFYSRYIRRPPMDVKLYVGNLSYDTTEEDLRTLFSGAGTVKSVALIKDRATGHSKGFAFIEMSSQSEAEEAIKTLNGTSLDHREIKVNLARPREERSSSGYGRRRGGKESRRY